MFSVMYKGAHEIGERRERIVTLTLSLSPFPILNCMWPQPRYKEEEKLVLRVLNSFLVVHLVMATHAFLLGQQFPFAVTMPHPATFSPGGQRLVIFEGIRTSLTDRAG